MRIIPLLLLVFLFSGPVATKKPADLVITGASVIDLENEGPNVVKDIAIKDGRILEVSPDAAAKYDAKRVIDAKGRFVIPGLADMHSHFGNGILPPEVDDTRQVLARHLYFGNTTILNMGSFQGSPKQVDRLRADIKSGRLEGPRLLAVGSLMTMPGSHPTTTIYSPDLQKKIAKVVKNKKGDGPIDLAPLRATTLVKDASDVSIEVKRVGRWGADAIKITVESGPDDFGDDHPQMTPEMISSAAREAKAFGIPVLCHISSLDELEACLENGAKGAVHAVTSDTELPADLERRMARAGFVLIPTAAMFEGWKRYTDDPGLLDREILQPVLSNLEKSILSSPRMIENFSSDEKWDATLILLGKHLKKFHDEGGMIVAGTDTGNPYRIAGLSLHEELAFYVKSGIPPREALKTATINAAKLVGAENEWGAIKPGLAADLLILQKDPLLDISNTLAIESVIKSGKIIDRNSLPLR